MDGAGVLQLLQQVSASSNGLQLGVRVFRGLGLRAFRGLGVWGLGFWCFGWGGGGGGRCLVWLM